MRDIGTSHTSSPVPGTVLASTEQAELEKLEGLIGNKEVSSAKISFAPP